MHKCRWCNLSMSSMFSDIYIDNMLIIKDKQDHLHCANCQILVISADKQRSINCSKYEIILNEDGSFSNENFRIPDYSISYIYVRGSHWRTRLYKEDIFEGSNRPHPSKFLWPSEGVTIFPFPDENRVIQKIKTMLPFL